MSFADKVVIITGASSGIGAATALLFSKEKASVVLVGRNEKKLKIVEAQCEEFSKKLLLIKADISNDYEAVLLIKQTIDKFGKLDILVNNAGIVRAGNIMNGNILESYDEVIKTNLRAIINLTQLASSHLIRTKGNIINISSVAGMKPVKGNIILGYGMSKAALNYFTEGAALELADHGVRVNVISPGPVITDVFANSKMQMDDVKELEFKTMGDRVSTSEEVGNMILYLASDKAVGVTGSNFVIDNGVLLLN